MNQKKGQKEIEKQLNALFRQVEAMDMKLRSYLADRQSNPNPRYEELIEKIQRFRIDPGITSKYLETMLDNLQWKAFYHSRAWKQLWENAEARRKNERKREWPEESGENGAAGEGAGEDRPVYSVDRLWQVQKQKLDTMGEGSPNEEKEAFIRRIKQRYGQLASEKKEDEEIYMKFDPDEKRCTLEKRKRDGEF